MEEKSRYVKTNSEYIWEERKEYEENSIEYNKNCTQWLRNL